MSTPRLSQTSYMVLGLLEMAERATPYDLKQLAARSTGNFWALPHTQLYNECARLAGLELLGERREESGRRRRTYWLTVDGRRALQAWREAPTEELYELRDAGMLKLFFGGDPVVLAESQLEAHTERLRAFEELRASAPEMSAGALLALEGGIGHEREFLRFWRNVRATGMARSGSPLPRERGEPEVGGRTFGAGLGARAPRPPGPGG